MIRRKIRQWRMIVWGSMGILSVIMGISIAEAQQPVDFTDYFYATVTYLTTSQELTIFHSEVKGIVRDNLETKKFDNLTSYCLRSGRVVAGKTSGNTYSKFMDSDGDFFVTETIADGVSEATWRFIQGTGKWKGITGGGTARFIFMTRGKQQITPTTFQGHLRMTGTFELQK